MSSKWYTVDCQDCGCEISVHEDWDRTPTLCKSCLQERKDKWYDKSCSNCGSTIRINKEWDNPPSLCKSCIERKK